MVMLEAFGAATTSHVPSYPVGGEPPVPAIVIVEPTPTFGNGCCIVTVAMQL